MQDPIQGWVDHIATRPERTRQTYASHAKAYSEWLDEHDLDVRDVETTDVLRYVDHLKAEDFAPRTIGSRVTVARHIHGYLDRYDETDGNPATTLPSYGRALVFTSSYGQR